MSTIVLSSMAIAPFCMIFFLHVMIVVLWISRFVVFSSNMLLLWVFTFKCNFFLKEFELSSQDLKPSSAFRVIAHA